MLRLCAIAALCTFAVDAMPRGGDPTAWAGRHTGPPRALSLATGPLRFEENVGQFTSAARYVARDRVATVFLDDDSVRLAVHDEHATQPVTLRVMGAHRTTPLATDRLPSRTNYFRGNDPTRWRSNVANYGRVTYAAILDGTDLVLHGEAGRLEYDFVTAPGAVGDITVEFEGLDSLAMSDDDVILRTHAGEFRQLRPRAYQTVDGVEREIPVSCNQVAAKQIAFHVARHDGSSPVIIDPVLDFSTYLGGKVDDRAYCIAVDAKGAFYVAGETSSPDFPTLGAFQREYANGVDAFVTKFAADGSAVYSTYLGGGQTDRAHGIAIDPSGDAYVTGDTLSTDFPMNNPLQSANHGSWDTFVTELDSSGSALVYSTYIGGMGADDGESVAVDASGDAYVAGLTDSNDFPTKNPFQATVGGKEDAYVSVLAPNGSGFVYSTYLGGIDHDIASGVAVDADRAVYVAGRTFSANFPVQNAFQPKLPGGAQNAFVSKLAPSGASLEYSTFLGGSCCDQANAIAVDSGGDALVTGLSRSFDFPLKNAFQSSTTGWTPFVTKLDASGASVVYSTFLGGTKEDEGNGIAVDANGDAYVTGYTSSTDYPTKNPIQASNAGTYDAFVSEMNPTGSALLFSTYFGGSQSEVASGVAVDSVGNIYFAGTTGSTDLPTLNAFQSKMNATSYNAFVAKIAPVSAPALVISPALASVPPKGAQSFTAAGGSGWGYTFALQINASGATIDPSSGVYVAGKTGGVSDIVRLSDSAHNTVTAQVTVGPAVTIAPTNPSVAPLGTVDFTASGGSGTGYVWALGANKSGASINPSAGAYMAGTATNVADTVAVTDSLGNAASTQVMVTGSDAGADAGSEGGHDGGVDAGTDAASDAGTAISDDAGADGGSDANDGEGGADGASEDAGDAAEDAVADAGAATYVSAGGGCSCEASGAGGGLPTGAAAPVVLATLLILRRRRETRARLDEHARAATA